MQKEKKTWITVREFHAASMVSLRFRLHPLEDEWYLIQSVGPITQSFWERMFHGDRYLVMAMNDNSGGETEAWVLDGSRKLFF